MWNICQKMETNEIVKNCGKYRTNKCFEISFQILFGFLWVTDWMTMNWTTIFANKFEQMEHFLLNLITISMSLQLLQWTFFVDISETNKFCHFLVSLKILRKTIKKCERWENYFAYLMTLKDLWEFQGYFVFLWSFFLLEY